MEKRKGELSDAIRLSILAMMILVFGLFIFQCFLNPVYVIETGKGAIFTKISGEKVAVMSVGWHLKIPLFENVDMKSIVNDVIFFPEDYVSLESGDSQTGSIGYDINAKDEKVVDVSAAVYFDRMDLLQWAVKNTNPTVQFQNDINSIMFNVLQSKTSTELIHDYEAVNQELLQAIKASGIEEQYGVRINSVKLIRSTFTKKALDALSNKQAAQAQSEGILLAAQNKANATITAAIAEQEKAEMLKSYDAHVLDYMSKIALYEALKDKPNAIWVIPSGQNMAIQAPVVK